MAKPVAFRHPEPMSAINVTPFIDVLLVLLIMLILTVPIATHKVPIDLPAGPSTPHEIPVKHKLAVDAAGRAYWDGRAVDDAELSGLLVSIAGEPNTELHFQADGETRYERADQLLAMIKRAGVTSMGFVGLDKMRF